MTKECLLEKLSAKIEKYKAKFDEIADNPQFRNIAFGSAGYLSKASKNRLYKYRNQLGKASHNLELTKLCYRLVSGETFHYDDIFKIATDFLSERNPEIVSEFYTECFPIYAVTKLFNYILELSNAPYRKEILKYKLKYVNNSGYSIDIPLDLPVVVV